MISLVKVFRLQSLDLGYNTLTLIYNLHKLSNVITSHKTQKQNDTTPDKHWLE